ncbi:hypothetical protein C8F01DRAFT_1085422 [Mycena amicta]|nr:hypothetical protein C8F01DRAFT_1085422 [Mycena amicta]
MPCVAQTSTTSRSRKPYSAPTGKTAPSQRKRFPCLHPGCEWSFDRPSDLRRHQPKHLTEEERAAIMHTCPIPGCPFKALQRVNLKTHMNVHTGAKPFECPDRSCSFASADRSCLLRHCERRHNGNKPTSQPRTRTRRSSSASTRSQSESVSDSSPHTSPTHTSSPLPPWAWDHSVETALAHMSLSLSPSSEYTPTDTSYDYSTAQLFPGEGSFFDVGLGMLSQIELELELQRFAPSFALSSCSEDELYTPGQLESMLFAPEIEWETAQVQPQFTGEWDDVFIC